MTSFPMMNGWWVEPVGEEIELNRYKETARLTPGMARWLAAQLVKAADEIEKDRP